jgi:hypothetical protein
MKAGAALDLPAPAGRTVFLYVVKGTPVVSGTPVAEHSLVALGDGHTVSLSAEGEATLLFGHGEPFREPIVAHGPFVMNSREEIVQAVRDYQSGRLGAL